MQLQCCYALGHCEASILLAWYYIGARTPLPHGIISNKPTHNYTIILLNMACSTQSAGIVSALTFPLWSSLPVELKEIVLKHRLVPCKQPITARMHAHIYGPLLAKLMSVSAEMHELVVATYYRCDTFEISRSRLGSAGFNWFRLPPTTIGRRLHHIQLKIELPSLRNFHNLDRFFRLNDDIGHDNHEELDAPANLRLARAKHAQKTGVVMMPCTNVAGGTSYVDRDDVW